MNTSVRDARHEQEQLDALHRLDEECVHLQRAGNYLHAFDRMERALVLRRHFFGADSPEVVHACRALAEMCNLLSMSFLQQENYAVTLELLKKAEILSLHHPKEKATTLNNLACYYRRLGKLHTAMACLKKALTIETKTLRDARNAADTHLNLCAVLSQLNKHEHALEHAQAALVILQEEFFTVPTGDATLTTTATTIAQNDSDSHVNQQSAQLERVSVMCIAYHNMGVEQEFLKDYESCVLSYKKGVGLAEQYLGVDHAITTTIRNSFLAAKRTIATKPRNARPASTVVANSKIKMASPNPRALTPPSSLRLPSPIAKEKQPRRELPSPRSIVADALARGNTLPPLDAPLALKKQATMLLPEDPFFSPRFRFDLGTSRVFPAKNVESSLVDDPRVSSNALDTSVDTTEGQEPEPLTLAEQRQDCVVVALFTEHEGRDHKVAVRATPPECQFDNEPPQATTEWEGGTPLISSLIDEAPVACAVEASQSVDESGVLVLPHGLGSGQHEYDACAESQTAEEQSYVPVILTEDSSVDQPDLDCCDGLGDAAGFEAGVIAVSVVSTHASIVYEPDNGCQSELYGIAPVHKPSPAPTVSSYNSATEYFGPGHDRPNSESLQLLDSTTHAVTRDGSAEFASSTTDGPTQDTDKTVRTPSTTTSTVESLQVEETQWPGLFDPNQDMTEHQSQPFQGMGELVQTEEGSICDAGQEYVTDQAPYDTTFSIMEHIDLRLPDTASSPAPAEFSFGQNLENPFQQDMEVPWHDGQSAGESQKVDFLQHIRLPVTGGCEVLWPQEDLAEADSATHSHESYPACAAEADFQSEWTVDSVDHGSNEWLFNNGTLAANVEGENFVQPEVGQDSGGRQTSPFEDAEGHPPMMM